MVVASSAPGPALLLPALPLSVLLLCLCGCEVGPNYKRPALDVPCQYRGIAPDLSQQAAAQSFAEMKWPSVYQDPELQALLKEALVNNYDIRIAAARIMESAASLGITRADQFPTLGGNFSIVNERSVQFPGAPTIDTLGLQMNYIVDFWGQYRRATEQARRLPIMVAKTPGSSGLVP